MDDAKRSTTSKCQLFCIPASRSMAHFLLAPLAFASLALRPAAVYIYIYGFKAETTHLLEGLFLISPRCTFVCCQFSNTRPFNCRSEMTSLFFSGFPSIRDSLSIRCLADMLCKMRLYSAMFLHVLWNTPQKHPFGKIALELPWSRC